MEVSREMVDPYFLNFFIFDLYKLFILITESKNML